jgi:hypothetical protein
VACVLHDGCSIGTQDKLVSCVLHDVCSSGTVGHWDTALNCIITYFFTHLSLLRWDITTSGFPILGVQKAWNNRVNEPIGHGRGTYLFCRFWIIFYLRDFLERLRRVPLFWLKGRRGPYSDLRSTMPQTRRTRHSSEL